MPSTSSKAESKITTDSNRASTSKPSPNRMPSTRTEGNDSHNALSNSHGRTEIVTSHNVHSNSRSQTEIASSHNALSNSHGRTEIVSSHNVLSNRGSQTETCGSSKLTNSEVMGSQGAHRNSSASGRVPGDKIGREAGGQTTALGSNVAAITVTAFLTTAFVDTSGHSMRS
jgi:hypothetical protein